MNYTATVSWSVVLLGILAAGLIGRKFSGGGMAFGLAIVIGVALFFVINALLPECVKATLCKPLGDEGIWYALYPLVAIPAYWLIAVLVPGPDEDSEQDNDSTRRRDGS